MRFLVVTLLSLGLQSLGGNEVGGNGDGISAFFVRAAYVLQSEMAKHEAMGQVYLKSLEPTS